MLKLKWLEGAVVDLPTRPIMEEPFVLDADLIQRLTDLNVSLLDHLDYINLSRPILEEYVSNRAVDDESFWALVATYSMLIVAGATGNGLVCLVVARKPQMRTTRNVFIINLAISDLLLCVFTMPFTLTEILLKSWPLGVVLCKTVSALQATSIFVSTMSITAIALDRYNVIVYPTREWTKRLGAVAIVACIWLLALVMALPLFIFRTMSRHYVGLPQLESVSFCYEQWPIQNGRAYYSIASMVFQYLVPIAIVTVAYARICRKLQNRMSSRALMNCSGQVRDIDHQRIHRTNMLLISIALIFGVSWLPLNILNVVSDFYYSFSDVRTFKIVFASCHVIGMSSACSNPLLYGWLNDNFRKEFQEVFAVCCACLSRIVRCRRTSSAVPLVIYTKHGSARRHGSGGGGCGTNAANCSEAGTATVICTRNGFEETTTVVTQVTNNGNGL